MTRIRRLGVLSCGKVIGLATLVICFAFLFLFYLFSFVGGNQLMGWYGYWEYALVLLVPIIYGIFGLLGGMIFALVFNRLGGIQADIDLDMGTHTPAA